MNRQKLERACEAYIESLHTTCWGRSFEVKSKRSSMPEAANFLADAVEGVLQKEEEMRDASLSGYVL